MGCRHDFAIKGITSAIFGLTSDVVGFDWRIVITTRLSGKTMCSVTAKQHNCRFCVRKRNIKDVAAGFALFTVVETSRFIV